MSETVLTPVHRRRLREVWRSAGWPCQDLIEAELLVAGLLERRCDAHGRETLRVTDAGLAVIVETLQRNRRARDDHESLVERVATEMQRAGRVVWCGLPLRAPLPGEEEGTTRWAMAIPDVYSIRHTTREDQVEPTVHEVKVRRSDLLSDLRHADKGGAYSALASQCWYVLREGIGEPEEIPECYGVLVAAGERLLLARPAPRRGMRLPFALWMALARAPARAPAEDPQAWLGEVPDDA